MATPPFPPEPAPALPNYPTQASGSEPYAAPPNDNLGPPPTTEAGPADLTNAKIPPGAVYPENALANSRFVLEPLIEPAQLKDRFLFGIPLASPLPDPITRKRQIMTDAIIQDIINGAVSTAETDIKIDIFPVFRKEKDAFDIQLYNALGYFMLPHRPCYALVKLSVTPSNEQDVYVVPNQWIEGAYLIRGQFNIIPLTVAFVQGTYIPQQSSGGAAFLQILGNKAWIPAWWQYEYVTGYPQGSVPRIVNDYIGICAAMEILSQLAALYRVNSHSLGTDGLSQSVSGPGPQLYGPRLKDLAEKRQKLMGQLKAFYGYKIFSATL